MAANNEVVTDTDSVVETDAPDDPEVRSDGSSSTTADSTVEESTELPLDQVFEILKNERRRTVIGYLENHEEPVSLGDLAEFVAGTENDIPVKQVSSRERKCAYVGLYQCHLPKMDSMDIIDFNQSRGLVETGPNAAQLKEYMGRSRNSSRSWPLYYAGFSVIGGVSVVAAWAAGATGSVVLGVALACIFGTAAIATVHHRSDT